jgi:hypothetical protein
LAAVGWAAGWAGPAQPVNRPAITTIAAKIEMRFWGRIFFRSSDIVFSALYVFMTTLMGFVWPISKIIVLVRAEPESQSFGYA